MSSEIEAMEHRLVEMEKVLNDAYRLIEEHDIAHNKVEETVDSTLARLTEASERLDLLVKAHRYSDMEYVRLLSLPAEKKQILIAGWYGAENLGDELMLKTLLSYFSEEMLLRTTVLLWDCENYPRFELDRRIRTIHYPKSTWDLESLADAYDVIVWGGGAIIDEEQFTNDPDNVNTGNIFIRLSELALARKKRVFCLGLSSNRIFEDVEYAVRLRDVIAKAEVFSVRDSYSAKSLKCLGAPVEAIAECQDIVFANKDILRLRAEGKSQQRGGVCYKLGVVFLFTEGRLGQYTRIVEEICAVLEKIKPLYEVALIPFLNEGEIDVRLYERIRENASFPESIRVVGYSEKAVLEELSSCNFCICYKYHAALIANLLGVQSLNVCYAAHPHYHNKMRHLADIFQYQSHLVSSEDFEKNVTEILTDAILDAREPVFEEALGEECAKWIQEMCDLIAER